MVSLFDPLHTRSAEPEWLDDAAMAGPSLERNLLELEMLNRYLGGHASVLRCVRRALHWLPGGGLRLVDVGCGSGDALRTLADWARSRGRELELIGIDVNPAILDYARKRSRLYPSIRYQQVDAFADELAELQPDLILASLFCHHFNSEQLTQWLSHAVRAAPVVALSDLQRHPLPHVGFRALAALLRASPMTRHDGAVSIRRGFVRDDLQALISRLSLRHASIHRSLAFRYEVLLVSSN